MHARLIHPDPHSHSRYRLGSSHVVATQRPATSDPACRHSHRSSPTSHDRQGVICSATSHFAFRISHSPRPAFALPELLLTLLIIALLFAGMVIISNTLRAESSQQRTRTILLTLAQALAQYQTQHQATPAGPTEQALRSLIADPNTAPLLHTAQLLRDPAGEWMALDGMGNRLHYEPADPSRNRPAAFVSPGPDGLLGNLNSPDPQLRRQAADNLWSSDLETP